MMSEEFEIMFSSPNSRISCLWFIKTKIQPALINNRALNLACEIKWKKAILLLFILILNIIIPSCLRVDSAINFLRSGSIIAANPAITDVSSAVDKVSNINGSVSLIDEVTRIMRKIPAVTSVDEWTSAETGVGAAMAAGSHEENGAWALLVKDAIRRKSRIADEKSESLVRDWLFTIELEPAKKNTDKHDRIKASPMRLVNLVTIPENRALGVW